MTKFLKKTDLQLINGGYLSDKDGNPVTNETFIAIQKRAEYVCTFAKLAKGKDFKGKEADSLDDLRKAVAAELSSKDKVYVEAPKKIVKKLADSLAEEAMAFMSFEKESSKVDKMNAFLQDFNTLAEFEEFGLFFENGIVKLNKIYTMGEVVESVQATIDLLN